MHAEADASQATDLNRVSTHKLGPLGAEPEFSEEARMEVGVGFQRHDRDGLHSLSRSEGSGLRNSLK
jgi:hypothetical protein